MTKKIVLVVAMLSCLTRAGTVHAQTPAPDAQPPAAPAAAQAPPSAAPITDADLKAAVKPTDRANGDPDGVADRHRERHRHQRSGGGPDARRRAESDWRQPDRRQFRLDAALRLPDHVHAGRICGRRSGTVPRQERQPHDDDELHGVRRRHARVLSDRLPASDGRRRRHREPRRDAGRSIPSSRFISSARTSASSATPAIS